MTRRHGGGVPVGGLRKDSLPEYLRVIVRRMYEVLGAPMVDILKAVEVAAGEPVSRTKTVNYVKYHNLARPSGWSQWDAARGGTLWTADRDNVLQRDYGSNRPRSDILAELNGLPGRAVDVGQLKVRVKTLELRRPRVVERPARAGETPWSAERMDLLRQDFDAGKSADDILAALNKLEGRRIGMGGLRAKAGTMGLYWSRRPGQCKPAMVARPLTRKVVKANVYLRPVPPSAPLPAPVAAAVVPEPAPLPAWVEPPVGPDGFVALPFLSVRHWCLTKGFDTDGTDVERVNKARRFCGLPPMVIDWTAEVAA